MPTYEYVCSRCKHAFELFQSITEAPKKTCPKCKGRLKRLIGGGGGLLFKGSGFYLTDYRSDGYKKKATEETKPAGDTKKSDTSGSDGKVAKPKKKPKSGESSDKRRA